MSKVREDIFTYCERFAALSALLCLSSIPAVAQTSQPKMNEPAVDEFGLEHKSGRVEMTTPIQIAIGGKGDSELSASYHYESTMMGFQGFREVGYPVVRYSLVILSAIEKYDYYSIEYSGVSETFRRLMGSNGVFEAEYKTGASLVQSGANLIFTDKFGVKVFISSNRVSQITYPNGKTIEFKISPQFTVSSVINNFGYELRRYQATLQAINKKIDYCDISLSSLCSGLQGFRQSSSSAQSSTQADFTDASGGVTRYRLVEVKALEREPLCSGGSSWGGIPSCDTPYLAGYYYPAGMTLPGSSIESITANYAPLNLPPPPYNLASNPSTHDDVRVATIVKNGIRADYSYTKAKYGTWEQANYNVPYRLGITTVVNGLQVAYTLANKPNSTWRVSGRRYLEYAVDGLNRRTDFGFNELKDVSSSTLPEGNGTRFIYDVRFNVIESQVLPKPNSGQAPLITKYSYPATCSTATQVTCNLPLTVTDPKGNVTEFAYNAFGQIVTETKPAANIGGIRQVVTNTYTMRTAYIKDANGAPVAAGPPISLLTRSSTCRTQAVCAGTIDEIVTAYDYGPTTGFNNLSLRGIGQTAANAAAQLETLLTCFGYNYFGEKISETKPKAGLTSCP